MAVDGLDTSDIMLIDSNGCPTDVQIMGFVKPVTDKNIVANSRILEIPFDGKSIVFLDSFFNFSLAGS